MDRPAGGGGLGGEHSGGPNPRRMLNATHAKYGGLADSAAAHGKRYGTGCAGMAKFPLPAIWPRSLRPPPLL